jgi:hypothetical protein
MQISVQSQIFIVSAIKLKAVIMGADSNANFILQLQLKLNSSSKFKKN